MALAAPTGLLINNKMVICGGTMDWDIVNEKCYELKHGNDTFQLVYSMKEARFNTKGVMLQNSMLVTGGVLQSAQLSDTGEYINLQLGNNTAPKPNIQLLEPIAEHSIIKINQSMFLLTGGINNEHIVSNKTYFWKIDTNEWKSGPDLKIGRTRHTAGVLIDHSYNSKIVAVVGGQGTYFNVPFDSVELLIPGQNVWSQGKIWVFKLSNQILVYIKIVKWFSLKPSRIQ